MFQVSRSLEARLQAIQTTRTLCALARSPDGALYCGGEDRRVLRWQAGFAGASGRSPGRWVRTGTAGAPGVSVRALVAAPDRVVAFCDDGSILDGVVPSVVSSLMPAPR